MKQIFSFVILLCLLLGCGPTETAVITPTSPPDPTNTAEPMPTETAVLDQETINNNLRQAALDNDADSVAQWLAVGANPNLIDESSDSPLLTLTAVRGFVEPTQLLIEAGADIMVENSAGYTSLHMAAIGGHVELIDLFLEAGIPINSTSEANRYHSTPLMQAIFNGQDDAVVTLIAAGADLEIGDKFDDPALSWAAVSSTADVMEMLLKAGADPNASNKTGITPMDWSNGSETEKEQLLLAYGANSE